jgi:hypothetical protein
MVILLFMWVKRFVSQVKNLKVMKQEIFPTYAAIVETLGEEPAVEEGLQDTCRQRV